VKSAGSFVPLIAAAVAAAAASRAAEPLPSWNDGPARQAILQFVARVTVAGATDFVPPSGRIAVFDNDGTLWAEQPMYFQALFIIDRVKALAPRHPEWKTQEPFASLREHSRIVSGKEGKKALAGVLFLWQSSDSR